MQSWKKGILVGVFSSLLWDQQAVEAAIDLTGKDANQNANYEALATPVAVTAGDFGTGHIDFAQERPAIKPFVGEPIPWEKYIPNLAPATASGIANEHTLLAERNLVEQKQAAAQTKAVTPSTDVQTPSSALASRGDVTTTYEASAQSTTTPTASQQTTPQQTSTAQTTSSQKTTTPTTSNSAPTLMSTSGVSSTIGNRAVTIAMQYLGVPYRYGGTTPNGFDCSGFLQYVMKQVGIDLPRTTYQQIQVGIPVSKANLRPGDLLFFSCGGQATSHSGMYVGNGKFIHADLDRGIAIADLNSSYWAGVYQAAVRVN